MEANFLSTLAGAAPRYRHSVLEPGGSLSANDLARNDLAATKSFALKHWLGRGIRSSAESEGALDRPSCLVTSSQLSTANAEKHQVQVMCFMHQKLQPSGQGHGAHSTVHANAPRFSWG